MKSVFERHKKIAFQFSGGKDSTAALLSLKDFWNEMTIYFVDSGDLLPETYDFVDLISSKLPKFEVIKSDSVSIRKSIGDASDAIVSSRTSIGTLIEGGLPSMLDTHTCCYLSMMKPMQDRMEADGITLIIRGQKKSDVHKGQLSSGDVRNGIEYLFPIEEWSDEMVMDYLRDYKLPDYYEFMSSAPDCKSCTGWWGENRMAYLSSKHPELARQYAEKLLAIRGDLANSIKNLDKDLESYTRGGHAN